MTSQHDPRAQRTDRDRVLRVVPAPDAPRDRSADASTADGVDHHGPAGASSRASQRPLGGDDDGGASGDAETGPERPEFSGEVWEPPIPLSAHRTLPAFPVDVLPTWLAETVNAVAIETQTPVDLPGCLALAMLSTAAGGRAVVNVRGNWTEPVNLFVVVAMPPGSRKSPVFSIMVRPLHLVEAALVEQTRDQIAAAQLEQRLARTRADKAARAAEAAEPAKAPDASEAARAAALEAEAITVPVTPRLFADDVTPETVASIMAKQGGRLAVLSAEGGIIGTLAGRYSSQPNYDVFLKGHAGDMLLVDRQSRDAERVDRAALTLGLAIQPIVLRELAKVPAARDKGLLARFLYSWPEDLVGRREIYPPTAPRDLIDTYTDNLTTLTRTLAEWTDPAVLTLTPEASELCRELLITVEPKLAPAGDWNHLRDWASKWVGHIARIAGLLHLADHPHDGWTRNIDATTWQRAQAIGTYYATHAEAVFDHMGADPTLDDARTLHAWIERTRPNSFTVRDAHRANRTHFHKAEPVATALDLLEQHNHVQRVEQRRDGPGRKPSPTYFVHPLYRTSRET